MTLFRQPWALLLVAGVLLLAAGACSPEPVPAANADGGTGFVTVRGTRLLLDGLPYYFVGANCWYGMNLSSTGPGGDRPRLDRELDLLRGLGITNLRVMAGSEGPNSEPWRVVPALMPAPGVYDPRLLDGLDYLLAAAARREMRLVLCLNNFWPWTGGMAQYVAWDCAESIPYPVGPEGDWDAYQQFAARFYSSPGACSAFRRHITTMVQRVNSLTGIAYRDDPVIMAWELANEPRGMGNAEAFNAWIDETAAFIKSIDPNHLVTTGCEGYTPLPVANGLDFVANHDGPDIDYATVHIWPQNWGWYDPAQEEATHPGAVSQAVDYLQQHHRLARHLDKPLVLEEFGLARDWDPLHDIHDPDSPTSYRDQFFEAMFDEVYASALDGGAGAGDNIWAYGGEGRPGDPAPQWIGDPPHEEPGWYSVYDTDARTLALMSSHAAEMNSLVPEPSSFELTITPTASNPGNYDFEWESQDGKLYDLVSDTGLATAPGTWSVWNSQADIASGGTTTSLTNIPGGADPTRFFAVLEKDHRR
jgi:mannan endo-1,4-beta-mannosidase